MFWLWEEEGQEGQDSLQLPLMSRPCQQLWRRSAYEQGAHRQDRLFMSTATNTLVDPGVWIESLILKHYALFLWNSNLPGCPVFLFTKSEIPNLTFVRKMGKTFTLVAQSYSVPSGTSSDTNTRTISRGLWGTILEPSYLAWEDNQSRRKKLRIPLLFSSCLVTVSFVVQAGALLWVTSTWRQRG